MENQKIRGHSHAIQTKKEHFKITKGISIKHVVENARGQTTYVQRKQNYFGVKIWEHRKQNRKTERIKNKKKRIARTRLLIIHVELIRATHKNGLILKTQIDDYIH